MVHFGEISCDCGDLQHELPDGKNYLMTTAPTSDFCESDNTGPKFLCKTCLSDIGIPIEICTWCVGACHKGHAIEFLAMSTDCSLCECSFVKCQKS